MDDQATGRPPQNAPTAPENAADIGGETKLWRSEELMQGRREVIILHDDKRYRLVVTRNGKLILQK